MHRPDIFDIIEKIIGVLTLTLFAFGLGWKIRDIKVNPLTGKDYEDE